MNKSSKDLKIEIPIIGEIDSKTEKVKYYNFHSSSSINFEREPKIKLVIKDLIKMGEIASKINLEPFEIVSIGEMGTRLIIIKDYPLLENELEDLKNEKIPTGAQKYVAIFTSPLDYYLEKI